MAGSFPTPWKTNVLGVLGECEYCFPSMLCPAFAYYSISESFEIPPAGVMESCAGGYCICFGFLIRSRLRNRYNLDGSFIGDFLAHIACHCVALARIWREAEIQGRIESEAKRHSQQPQQPPPHLQSPPFQSFAPHVPPGPVHPQPYVPVGGAIGLGFYDPSFAPQPALQPVLQPGYRYDQGNTVDTSLSGFEVDNGIAESTSYVREDSLDPPPSNTDTNPWDMMQQGTEREDPAPIVLPLIRRQDTRTSAAVQGISSRGQTFRGDPLPQIVSQLEDQNAPKKPTEEEVKASSRQFQKEALTNKSSANLNSRLANLRPPKATPPLPAMTEEDSEAADRIILEHDSMLTLQEVEDDLLDSGKDLTTPSPQQSKE